MPIIRVASAGRVHPFGDERTVSQAFPSAVTEHEADPFLMCDFFDMPSEGVVSHPDSFPIDWHPHRGMDILTYLIAGVGRHGDSMGNRENFATPGMQWISCGSGIEHAEGGATPKGENMTGFQIWINVPADKKMDDPRYGTEPPESIPLESVGKGARARLLAGEFNGRVGQFSTVAPVQMIDFELEPGARCTHTIPSGFDTAVLYFYLGGGGSVAGTTLEQQQVALLDATSDSARSFELAASDITPLRVMLFAGKKLKEPIAWHGPIVMNTQEQLQATFMELRTGRFPPVRAAFDYKRLSDFPDDHVAKKS